MGYYSDAALVLTHEGCKSLNKLIKASIFGDEAARLLNDADKVLKRDGCILYMWQNIKWYCNFPDVDLIQRAVEIKLPQEDFYFIRIGENLGDIEEQGTFYDNPFSLCAVNELSFS